MAIIPCPNKIGCESDNPLTNYSSEDPDPRLFLGYSTGTAPTSSFTRNVGGGGPRDGGPDRDDTGDGPDGTAQTGTGGLPPPLGSTWDNAIITTFAQSEESQAQAHDDAGNNNVSSLGPSSDTGEDTGGWLLPPNRVRPAVFRNDAQTCTIICPDGQPFSFTVPANAIAQLSKAKANAAALSYACKQAGLNLICLSAINGKICLGSSFLQAIIAYTVNIPVTFTIIDGDLPSWMSAEVHVDRVILTGTPSTTSDVGVTTFTIAAVDVFGNAMSRVYQIDVFGVSSANPSDGVLGSPYSFQVTADGGTAPYTFSVSSGNLPTGVEMDAEGLIEGTPIIADTYDFTIEIRDATGRVCAQELSLDVLSTPTCPAIVGSAIAVTSLGAGMANVGDRVGNSNLMLVGSTSTDQVVIIDTTIDVIAGGVSTGVGFAIGVAYVPEVVGALHPSDCMYVTSPDGILVSVDLDTLAVSSHGSTGDTLTNLQRPCVYATTPNRLFFNTLQGISFGPGDNPTATLWYFPILGGAITAARVSTNAFGQAFIALSHYVESTNQIWYTDEELGGSNNSLTAINASTLVLGATITLIDLFTGPGTWCSLNNRFYVPVYPGGPFSSSPPYRLDVRTAGGSFIHALSLPSVCRKVVVDTSRGLILALCADNIRCFDITDNFVCDIPSATAFQGAFCPENAKAYISLLATMQTVG